MDKHTEKIKAAKNGLDEIAEKYEEKNYFRRLADMMSGLKMPVGTPEYKKARTELQRQKAPIVAVASVAIAIAILTVVTAMQKDDSGKFTVTVQDDDSQIIQIDDPDTDPEPPPDPDPTPLADIDIQLDIPNPGPVTDIAPAPSPQADAATTKPAEANAVSFVNSPVKLRTELGGRDTGIRGRATGGGAGYGDGTTESAILKVLWWLKATQKTDGSWANGKGSVGSPVSNTGLAILTYLAHGEHEGSKSPYRRDFGPAVSAGIQYLLDCLQPGDNPLETRMKGSDGNEYAFLIGTYALCEAYAITRNPECKDAAMKALERIVRGQSPTGGWDYKVNPQSTRDDLSFAGWALQALKAGKIAGIHPEGLDECIAKAIRCLQSRSFRGGRFGYSAESNQHPGLTATGCLAMQLLGHGDKKAVRSSLDYMREWRPSFERKNANVGNDCPSPQYYCYYATQCKYQAGMRAGATKEDENSWYAWNTAMKALYPPAITDLPEAVPDWKGGMHKQGYYDSSKVEDAWTNDVMSSCFAALQLMVYYRYLPTNQLSAGATEEDAPAAGIAANKGDVNVIVDI